MTTWIDLTHAIDSQTPAYPGDPLISLEPAATVDHEGFSVHKIMLGTHAGTHVDSPADLLEDGKPLGAFALEDFSGRATVIDCRKFLLQGEIPAEILSPVAEENLDWVLLCTGAAQHWKENAYFSGSALVPSGALLERMAQMKLKGFGLDAAGPDRFGEDVRHKRWFALTHALIVENLVNLEVLVGRRFQFFAVPLKTAAADGAPVRAFALL